MASIASTLTPPPSGNHLFDALRAAFPAERDRVAIETESGLAYTWDDLDRGSALMARVLERLGLPPGSRVAVQVDKSVEALMLYLASLRAGWVMVPLNTAYQPAEMQYFIENAEPAVVVCTPANFPWLSALAFQRGVQQVLTLGDDRTGSLLERAAHYLSSPQDGDVAGRQPGERHTPVPRGPDDLAAILYTSGTTGRSKGAMLSHGNLLSNAQTLQALWDFRPDDVLIHALPIFHVHGLFVASHAALLNGSPMLWLGKFEPKAVIERLPRATVFMGVPTLYVRLLQEAGLTREACAAMRLFISGSAPLLIDTFTQWQARTGHTILERYGMSETIMLTSNPCRDADGVRKAGTVGPALPGVGVRVVASAGPGGGADGVDGHDPSVPPSLPAGEIGDVQVRGPNVFQGYWRMPEKTAEEFTADGWFKTGDVGRFDADGYLTIVGRSKDLIITGGYNVYPAEVEACLNDLPGVQESAVIGVPHPDFGEGVVAVVVARARGPEAAALTPEALIQALKTQLAGYKVPKRIVISAELPRNTMGKVQKNLLRQSHAALLTPA